MVRKPICRGFYLQGRIWSSGGLSIVGQDQDEMGKWRRRSRYFPPEDQRLGGHGSWIAVSWRIW